ncbi:MAG: retroviral-like aspartic protease family protein [Myxococcota bacterium]
MTWLLCSLVPFALAKPKASTPREFLGPDHSEVDLLRPAPGASRIFVQALLPDGEPGLFLVDTGADISVLTQRTADRIGLQNLQEGEVWGLSGTARVRFGTLPSLQIGEMMVTDIHVAVGVPGLNDEVGFMPLAGLLGNNVWSRFTLEIDYPADLMVLHDPITTKAPRGGAPMFFRDRAHIETPIELKTAGERSKVRKLVAQVDTGASELTLCAATGLPFEDAYTQGLETVRGIGASETLPPFRFLEMTRRIPLQSVTMGGTEVEVDLPARWMAYQNRRTTTCGGGMKALIGHEYLSGHRVWFDYRRGQMALRKSRRSPRQLNGHEVLYEQELKRHGRPIERGLVRAKLLLGHGEDQSAIKELRRFLERAADAAPRAEARVLLAQLLRQLGRHDEAWSLLESMDAGDLVDQNQVVGTVNGLLLTGRAIDALRLAKAGVKARPDDGWSHVAFADVMLYLGQTEKAQDSLLEAARLEQYRDAHLLRRARVALATGDRYGSMAHIRKLLELYPGGGPYLWFYAMLLDSELDTETFRADLERAMSRLHPHARPFDFLVAAHAILGDADLVDRWLAEGLAQHCETMPEGPDQDNCVAWYLALGNRRLEDALMRIERALDETGERADYLDTKAMVHLARREMVEARRAARHAARLSPNDVYMLWQAERIAELTLQAER